MIDTNPQCSPRVRQRRPAAARRDAGGVRRDPPRRVRRPRGAGGRDPLPPQCHARSRHPRREARGGGPPLPALRRSEPHQRAEPCAQGGDRGRARRAGHRSAGVLGQPQLGAVPRGGGSGCRGRRPTPRCWRSPPARTARTPAAVSTARIFARVLDATALGGTVTIDKVRQFFDHPGFRLRLHRRA